MKKSKINKKLCAGIALVMIVAFLVMIHMPYMFIENGRRHTITDDGVRIGGVSKEIHTDIYGEYVTEPEALPIFIIICESIGMVGCVLLLSDIQLALSRILLVFPSIGTIIYGVFWGIRYRAEGIDAMVMRGYIEYDSIPNWGMSVAITLLALITVLTLLIIFSLMGNKKQRLERI